MKTTNKLFAFILFGMFVFACVGCRPVEPIYVAVYRHSFDESKPQCRLYLQGAKSSDINLEKSSLVSRFVDRPLRYEVYGSGEFMWHGHRIQINKGNVMINGIGLPASEFKSFIVEQDGTVVSGYIPTAE